jgi:hypothetical protein
MSGADDEVSRVPGHVWDEVLGGWVPEVAPYVGAPSDYSLADVVSEARRDFTREILSEEEFGRGGFSVGTVDDAFLARVRDGEDRSTDTGQAATQAAFAAVRAALTAYQDAPNAPLRADQAAALAMRVENLLDVLGVQ